MKRHLIIVNTYYQLIMAIQMRFTIFQQDKVVVLISDHSRDADKIVERIKGYNLFEFAGYIETNNVIANRNKIDKLKDFFNIVFSDRNRFSYYVENITNKYFDEIICYNYSIDTYGVYSELYKYNPYLSVSMFEEGILSYGVRATMNYRRKIIQLFRHLMKKRDITDAFGYFYCMFPELYEGEMFQTVKVPKIENNDKCAAILKKIFNVYEEGLSYSQKYIFFTSVYDFEGGEPVGEYELVCKIADLVGRDNLLVKTHPRDMRTIYEDNGFHVDKNSAIPWEVIQISGDFSNKVFMTINSGSVLAGNTMSEKPVSIYYMYKLCNINGNISCQKSAHDIERLLNQTSMKKILKTVKIAESLEDIL